MSQFPDPGEMHSTAASAPLDNDDPSSPDYDPPSDVPVSSDVYYRSRNVSAIEPTVAGTSDGRIRRAGSAGNRGSSGAGQVVSDVFTIISHEEFRSQIDNILQALKSNYAEVRVSTTTPIADAIELRINSDGELGRISGAQSRKLRLFRLTNEQLGIQDTTGPAKPGAPSLEPPPQITNPPQDGGQSTGTEPPANTGETMDTPETKVDDKVEVEPALSVDETPEVVSDPVVEDTVPEAGQTEVVDTSDDSDDDDDSDDENLTADEMTTKELEEATAPADDEDSDDEDDEDESDD